MGFASFVGNEKAVTAVRAMLASGKVPGALLFSGPEGIGKKTLALMLARALNCERLKDDYCGACTACGKSEEMITLSRDDLARRREMKDSARRVEGLLYFDVQLIEPLTRFILAEQIRKLRSVAYTRPFELRHRIFIIDQAQTIHWQAADLLLKALEEPPDTTHFVLVSPNPHELRSTLRSRCQRVVFERVADAVVEGVLREKKKIPPAQLRLATRIADGSIGAAQNFDFAEFDRLRRPWADFLNAVTAEGLRSATAADWKHLFDSTKMLAESRGELEASLRVGYSLLRDLLHILATGKPAVHEDLAALLKAWAAALGLQGIARLQAGLDDCYRLQTRNVNQQLGWEALAAELMAGR